MPTGFWVRVTRLTECTDSSCERSLVRDDAAYMHAGLFVLCPGCALRRAQKVPPADLPHLAPIAPPPAPQPIRSDRLPLSDSSEPTVRHARSNWVQVPRKGTGEWRSTRRQLNHANAIDPKLKQLGGDR